VKQLIGRERIMQQLGAAACLVYVCLVCAGLVTVFFFLHGFSYS
jgi:hypothetical protein